MKCWYCGKEYSDKIIDIHMADCKGQKHVKVEKELTEEAIREMAKEKGIKSWHVKSIEKLKEELGV